MLKRIVYLSIAIICLLSFWFCCIKQDYATTTEMLLAGMDTDWTWHELGHIPLITLLVFWILFTKTYYDKFFKSVQLSLF